MSEVFYMMWVTCHGNDKVVTMNSTASEVLRFWFGPAVGEPSAAKDRLRFWFTGSTMLDREIQRRFGSLLGHPLPGALQSWNGDARECLAQVIVLDQFSRNIFRGTAEAFAQDPVALQVAMSVLDSGSDGQLQPLERAFLLMPFQHSESAEIQAVGVASYRRLLADGGQDWHEVVSEFLRSAREHESIVARFGRFPHRNEILGRISSPDEERYLAAGPRRFGQ